MQVRCPLKSCTGAAFHGETQPVQSVLSAAQALELCQWSRSACHTSWLHQGHTGRQVLILRVWPAFLPPRGNCPWGEATISPVLVQPAQSKNGLVSFERAMLKQLDMQILLLRLCSTYVLMIFRYALCLFFHSLIYWQTLYAVMGYCTVSVTHMHTHHCCCSWFLVVWAVENKALAGVLFQGVSFNECLLAFQQLFIISLCFLCCSTWPEITEKVWVRHPGHCEGGDVCRNVFEVFEPSLIFSPRHTCNKRNTS